MVRADNDYFGPSSLPDCFLAEVVSHPRRRAAPEHFARTVQLHWAAALRPRLGDPLGCSRPVERGFIPSNKGAAGHGRLLAEVSSDDAPWPSCRTARTLLRSTRGRPVTAEGSGCAAIGDVRRCAAGPSSQEAVFPARRDPAVRCVGVWSTPPADCRRGGCARWVSGIRPGGADARAWRSTRPSPGLGRFCGDADRPRGAQVAREHLAAASPPAPRLGAGRGRSYFDRRGAAAIFEELA